MALDFARALGNDFARRRALGGGLGEVGGSEDPFSLSKQAPLGGLVPVGGDSRTSALILAGFSSLGRNPWQPGGLCQ